MKILFAVSTGINILLGLYLFGDKIIDPEDFDPFLAFWLMIALVVAFGVVDFSLYIYGQIARFACEDRTIAMESENIEMKQYGSAGGHDAPKPRKDPSQVSWSGQHTTATVHGKILAGEKLMKLASRKLFAKLFLTNIYKNVHSCHTQ